MSEAAAQTVPPRFVTGSTMRHVAVMTFTGGLGLMALFLVDLVVFFCTFIAVSWAFAGAQFVANAAFNNLGRPNLSTWFNWGKATLGTIPFAWYGAQVAGPEGVLAGTALGSVIFGLASVAAAYRIVNRISASSA